MNDELKKDTSGKAGDWGCGKKRLTALNLTAMILISLAIIFGLNYLASQYYKRIDCTFARTYSLSDKTKTILKNLNEPVTVYTIFFNHEVIPKLKDLMEEYKSYSSKIVIEELSEANPVLTQKKLKFLSEDLKIDISSIGLESLRGGETPGFMIFVYTNRNKVVNLKDSYTPKYSGGWMPQETGVEIFRGEELITGAILNLIQGKQTMIYFTEGHQEPDINKSDGNGIAYVNDLLKRENIVIQKVDLMKTEKVPDDCAVLIMAGPGQPVKPHEIRLLNDYLSAGRKMMVLVDPLTETNLENFLKEWGVALDNNVVVDLVNCIQLSLSDSQVTVKSKDITVPAITDYGARQHPITKKMDERITTYFVVSRSMEPVKSAGPDLEIVEIARSSPESWGEIDLKSALENNSAPVFDKNKEKQGPLLLGLAVTKKIKSELSDGQADPGSKNETRLVVLGDSDMIKNIYLNPNSQQYLGTNDIFLNSVRWLAHQEQLISIEPKKPEDTKVDLNVGKRALVLMLVSLVFLPLFGVIAGISIWLMRRK
ncbi:MAG: GldG family protein [Planctomycetota bacterium]